MEKFIKYIKSYLLHNMSYPRWNIKSETFLIIETCTNILCLFVTVETLEKNSCIKIQKSFGNKKL